VTLSVIHKRGQPPVDIQFNLSEQPAQANTAKRFWAEDLGFAVRDLVFVDRYARRMPIDAPGVVVSLIRPQSAAQSGGLQGSNPRVAPDVVIQLNGQPVKDVESFAKLFKESRKEKPKDPVVLVVRREGREDTVRIEPPQ
jgi:S1-C subfamily serine protease